MSKKKYVRFKGRLIRLLTRENKLAALDPGSKIDQNFLKYHRENLLVWKLFVYYTLKIIEAGHRHQSADFVLHRIRWYAVVETTGDTFKLNNNYTPCYARLFHEAYPEHKGFFRTRIRKS